MSGEEGLNILAEHVEELATHQERVSKGLSEAQKSIEYGSHVLLLTTSGVKQSLVVGNIIVPDGYGMIRLAHLMFTPKDLNEKAGSDEEEAKLYEQGIRYGIFYAKDYPEGYTAHYHISRLFPITADEFAQIESDGFDIKVLQEKSWFMNLHHTVLNALETRPNSPQRVTCEKCGSRAVCLATYYNAVRYDRVAIRPDDDPTTPSNIEIRVGHEADPVITEETRRVFHCLESECGWESENMPISEFPETHACDYARSPLEALFEINDSNTI